MTTVKAHFDGKTFVPDEPVALPTNQPVTLHVDVTDDRPPEAAEITGRLNALGELEKLSEVDENTVDWSRDSIYSGTLDDPR